MIFLKINNVIDEFNRGDIITFLTVSTKKILFASLIWFVPVFSYLPFLAILSGTILMIIVVFFIGRMSRQKLDGITGDVLGATAFLSELAFLFGLVIYLSGLI